MIRIWGVMLFRVKQELRCGQGFVWPVDTVVNGAILPHFMCEPPTVAANDNLEAA